MTQSHIWSMLETWPKREAIQNHKLSKQGHVWTKLELGPNVVHQIQAQDLQNFNGNKDKQIFNFDPEIERTLRKLKKRSKQAHKVLLGKLSKKSLIIWLLKELRRKLWENILFPLLSAAAVA
ncbi:hypothetical protein PIB30_051677 [Stylosanthes scabra]|uniref:Uncharacterized protein n=1 Tax=Stylosanthes scabra TaxID=79078 RepID=A0ABU6TII2_9FABA|nr:hypothetical protein [Stylosanthes scabra]